MVRPGRFDRQVVVPLPDIRGREQILVVHMRKVPSASDVKPEIRLRDQLDLDSMDFLDIVMELRKQHGIDVPEAEYRELESLDSSANYLLPKFEAGATA